MTAKLASVLLLALSLAACSSTKGSKKDDVEQPQLIQMQPDDPIGKLLTDLDQAIARWSALTLTANSSREQREQRMLQQFLQERSLKRRDELIHELEAGPPINRMRAAAALGFTHSIEAQSPLLNALHDPDLDVVHNALLGLAILARADTPLDDVCKLAQESGDQQTRAQAAYALRSIVQAGGSGECALHTARRGLIDGEPFVRSQSTLTLGLLGDGESIKPIIDLLHDDVNLVSSAANEALVLIVKKSPALKGEVGRALVAIYVSAKDPLKERSKQALVQIADANYGDDSHLWIEWSERLP